MKTDLVIIWSIINAKKSSRIILETASRETPTLKQNLLYHRKFIKNPMGQIREQNTIWERINRIGNLHIVLGHPGHRGHCFPTKPLVENTSWKLLARSLHFFIFFEASTCYDFLKEVPCAGATQSNLFQLYLYFNPYALVALHSSHIVKGGGR